LPNRLSPRAGKAIEAAELVNVPRLVTAYYTGKPDPKVLSQRIAFGTSGHRGSAFENAFNETHILAICQAICLYRSANGVDGPLFIGIDTHALSEPALASALEVFAANEVTVLVDEHGGYTPTPVISHAIIGYNRNRKSGLADGVVITPSHNPPEEGGFKYNPPNGGPAGARVTVWIERAANAVLEKDLNGVRRIPLARARNSTYVQGHDYIGPYVADLENVLDMEAIRASGVKIGIDPLGGASVQYWARIIERYDLAATVVNEAVDPTFRFMTLDWDGKVRMDCSSSYAMARLIGLRDKFDVAFANDTDADRHGIVTRSAGLMNPNHFLAAAISYLFANRPAWSRDCGVGKTIVSSSIGFKWFVDGLLDGAMGFAGEESAGASFLRRDGSVWTTDKDGLILGLLSAEITARTGRDPSISYDGLTQELGKPFYERIDDAATQEQKKILSTASAEQIGVDELAGEAVTAILTKTPGSGLPIGGLKVITKNGWFAARPSGTEAVYKIYAESFVSMDHLRRIQEEAQAAIAQLFKQDTPV